MPTTKLWQYTILVLNNWIYSAYIESLLSELNSFIPANNNNYNNNNNFI